MATNFPSSLDSLTNPTGSDTLASPDHAGQHADANDAIEALQAKVGVDSSAVATSLDYKVARKLDQTQTLNAQTGTSYTLVSGDLVKLVTLNNSSAITVTVNTSLGLSAGQRIDLLQLGAGQVTVSASGTTVNGTPGLKLRAQYSAASLLCVASNSYVLVGDLSA